MNSSYEEEYCPSLQNKCVSNPIKIGSEKKFRFVGRIKKHIDSQQSYVSKIDYTKTMYIVKGDPENE